MVERAKSSIRQFASKTFSGKEFLKRFSPRLKYNEAKLLRDLIQPIFKEKVKKLHELLGAKKKAAATKEKDDMLDLNINKNVLQEGLGSAPADTSRTTETSKAKKRGRKPAASKAAKPPPAPRKLRKQPVTSTEAVTIEHLSNMRSSLSNQQSSSVMGRFSDE